MTFSPLTSRTVPHHNKFSSRNGRKPNKGINHHWAGIGGGDARLVNPNEAVSANYILYSTGELVGQVPEEYRAWTSGSWEADSWAITIEIQNISGRFPGAGDDDPRSWPISAAAWKTLVALWADIGTRYGWGTIDRTRIRGHREFDSTACPGGFLWHRLPALAVEADAVMKGVSPEIPEPKRKRRKNMLGLMVNDGKGRYGKVGEQMFATYDGRAFVYVSKADADPVSVNLDAAFANVTYRAFEGYIAAAEIILDATVSPPVRLSGPKGLAGTEALA